MTFQWHPRVIDDALKQAGHGLRAATIYFANCVKEILSVPAPRVTVTDSKGGKRYVAGFKLNSPARMTPARNYDITKSRVTSARDYRFPKGKRGMPAFGPPSPTTLRYSTAPAIAGEPPRKLSGRLRASITYEFLEPMQTFLGGMLPTKGRVGTNVKYAKRLEYGPGRHEFLNRTLRERKKEIEQVLYDNATGAGGI